MKAFDKYAKARFDSLHSNLEQYHQFQEQDSLHNIRINVKKIKAVLQVMDAALKKFDGHEQFIPFRNIFRKAGQIRQPEVMLHLLIRHGLEGLPIDKLGDPKKHQDEFHVEIPFYMEQIRSHGKEIRDQLKKVRSRDVLKYLSKQMKAIKSRLVPKMNAKELHYVRKKIKLVVYLSGPVKLLGKKKSTFYSDLEQAIGKLHDQEVLLGFLKASSVPIDPTVITSLRKSCTHDRRAIAAMAKEFYR